MTPHTIHDALSHLDDDLIEETDAVRHKRPRRLIPLICRVGAAACVCAVVGITAFHLTRSGSDTVITDETTDNPLVGDAVNNKDYNLYGAPVDQSANGTDSRGDGNLAIEDNADFEDGFIIEEDSDLRSHYYEEPAIDTTVDVPEQAYLTVRGIITAWTESGFYYDTVDGETLFITVPDTATFSVTDAFIATFTNAPPTESDLPVGSFVTVDADPDSLVAHHVSKGE